MSGNLQRSPERIGVHPAVSSITRDFLSLDIRDPNRPAMTLTPEVSEALERISPDSLRGHVYANMAKVDRMVAMGLLLIADGPAPRWSNDNPDADPYRTAAQRLYAE